MTNEHSPSNFHPENYEVIDYLDNKRPEYCGQSIDGWKAEIAHWEAEMAHYFPGWRNAAPNIHACSHCGNTNVRYIVAVEHTPSKEMVVFGSDCVVRLGFRNQVEFKAAQVRSRAELGNARMAVFVKWEAFMAANPELAVIVTQAENEVHAKNDFVRDVLGKLRQYGSISEAQRDAVVKSLARDVEYATAKANKPPAGPAPEGRVVVQGKVLKTYVNEGDYGTTYKMLVELANGSRVYCSIPSDLLDAGIKGMDIQFTATFTPKPEDKSFAYGKRPTKATNISQPVEVA